MNHRPDRMAYQCTFDPDALLAMCRYQGCTTGAEMAQSCRDMYGDPRWRPGMNVIVDLSGVSQLLLDPDEMRRFVETVTACRAAARPGSVFYVAWREEYRIVAQACAALLNRRGCRTSVMRSREDLLLQLGFEDLPPGLIKAGPPRETDRP